jgi:putative membrane protein
MGTEIDKLLDNAYASSLVFVSVTILSLIVFLWVFELVAKYKCWTEIKRGNMAVAMATGGKIFGICNIFRFSIEANDSIYQSLIWGAFGFVILLLAYFLFEFMTPVFRIDEEIASDNRAVGLIAMIISVSLSYVIGATVII